MRPVSRRRILSSAGGFALASGAGLTGAPSAPASRKLKVIVTGGHPGDPEYGCGGVIARYADAGHEVILLYLNHGEGAAFGGTPEELAALRTAEAAKACEILHARPVNAGHIDGKAIIDPPHYDAFRKILEAERPDVVFTQWPIDNHSDHRAISTLVYDAYVRMGRKFALYFYEVSNGADTMMFSPDEYVDISAVEPRKRAACYAHASQSPDRFYALQDQVARFRGLECGCARAEAFIRHVQSPVGLLPSGR